MKKWKFQNLGHEESEFRISSWLKFIYLRLKCLPLFIICIKRTYKWIRSVYIYASNRYGMTYTTLRYDISSELFKFELYILNRTLKWNKVCQPWKSKIFQTDLSKINLFVIQNFRNFFRRNDFQWKSIKLFYLIPPNQENNLIISLISDHL